jgi:hypothetical protein
MVCWRCFGRAVTKPSKSRRRQPCQYLFSTCGAAFIVSLAQRPSICSSEKTPALKARFNRGVAIQTEAALNRAFSAALVDYRIPGAMARLKIKMIQRLWRFR